MDTIKIDALGEQCPIPVVKTVKVIDGLEKAALLEVHVDNETAVECLWLIIIKITDKIVNFVFGKKLLKLAK